MYFTSFYIFVYSCCYRKKISIIGIKWHAIYITYITQTEVAKRKPKSDNIFTLKNRKLLTNTEFNKIRVFQFSFAENTFSNMLFQHESF